MSNNSNGDSTSNVDSNVDSTSNTDQNEDFLTLEPGTLFKLFSDDDIEDDENVYELIGYNTIGDSIIYVPAGLDATSEARNGHYDVTNACEISEIVGFRDD